MGAHYVWSVARVLSSYHLSHTNQKVARLRKIPLISIVDDDRSFRNAIGRLVKSLGYQAGIFASAEEFLQSDRVSDTACLILDVKMPGLSGIELQTQLIARGIFTPIIFVTAVPEERIRAKAIKAGAVGFLGKPIKEESLIDHLNVALKGNSGTGSER
jgi:FixJ family two-component response regulator